MIVFGTAVIFKKVPLIKVQSSTQAWTPGVVTGACNVAREAVEIVTRVEIVDPMVLRILPVPPGAIGALTRATVFHSRTCYINIIAVFGVFRSSGEHRGAEQVGVVD